MSRLCLFEEAHKEAMKEIEFFRSPESEMPKLTEWLLSTEANPYSFLSEGWGDSFTSSTNFVGLLRYISHALFDDGDITFCSVNGEPRIVFAWRGEEDFRKYALSELERTFENSGWRDKPYSVEILDINHEEFGTLYDEYHKKHLRGSFLSDCRERSKEDIEALVSHYSRYKDFDPSWADGVR